MRCSCFSLRVNLCALGALCKGSVLVRVVIFAARIAEDDGKEEVIEGPVDCVRGGPDEEEGTGDVEEDMRCFQCQYVPAREY